MTTKASLVAALALLAGAAGAQQTQDPEQAAHDPTAPLLTLQIRDYYTPKFHADSDATSNVVQFRGAAPFTLGGVRNVGRMILPFVSDSPSGGTIAADTKLVDIAVFDRHWGRWGLGASANVPTGEPGIGTGTWALGPAAIFMARRPKLLWGVFNQNYFSVAERFEGPDVADSVLEPVVHYKLGGGWSVGTSDMSFVYNWNRGAWTSLPLGLQINRVVRFGRRAVELSVSYEHNFYDGSVAPRDTYGFLVRLVRPIN